MATQLYRLFWVDGLRESIPLVIHMIKVSSKGMGYNI